MHRRYGGRPGPEWAAGDACRIFSPAAGGLIGFSALTGFTSVAGSGAEAEGPHARSKEVGAGSSTECRKAGLRWCLPGRPPRGCQCLSWPTDPGGIRGRCSGCLPRSAQDESLILGDQSNSVVAIKRSCEGFRARYIWAKTGLELMMSASLMVLASGCASARWAVSMR